MAPERANGEAERLGAVTIALSGIGAVLVLALLALWQGHGYWEYSDGVYAATARAVADGAALYRDVAAAQPPPLFFLAAGALTVSDTLAALRLELALVELATSALVLVATWHLTRVRGAAVLAALLALLTPWALREHAQLLPETFAAPLILAAALAAARPRGALAAGALGALAAAFKVAFGLPALAVVLLGRRPARGLAGLLATALALALVFLLAFGSPLWDETMRGQGESGRAGLHYVAGLWAQAGWNLVPLLVPAALAWPLRARLRDRALARSLFGAALGSLALLVTLFKQGSYLTVVVVAEPPLLCLGVAAATLLWQARRSVPASEKAERRRPPRPVTVALAPLAVVLAVVLGVAQIGALLISPGDPRPFTHPGAASGGERVLSSAAVDRAVAAIRRCPAGQGYGEPPYLAFVAGRAMAGDQPDQFILARARSFARFRARVAAAGPPCIAGAPPGSGATGR
jgi:hypothetical protein